MQNTYIILVTSAIDDIFGINWHYLVYTVFLLMASIIAIVKVIDEFAKLVKRWKNKGKEIVEDNPKNRLQDEEIEKIKARQDAFEANLEALKDNAMVSTWDRIVHFGMNYIARGYIDIMERDIFDAQCQSYKRCGGNGHLVDFVPLVLDLPLTEDLTDEERAVIDDDEVAKKKRIKHTKAVLASYYGKTEKEN